MVKKIAIKSEYITLGQFLKFAGIIDCGGYAKEFLNENCVLINNQEDSRRGRKLYPNDIIEIFNQKYEVVKFVD